ncbi:NAD-dependent succinate-semialdehyde dehydrogenase [Isoptericola sediminis]|uniref:NAD-dependent succinate-semialdehyde dehydrogenase n=1 Tax=Isoptericola sediminis TaxID=2733572 RepID=A0A849K5S1_9MICO|nr:NAD-dependent succinate-semialdehyde dehydrogenase [Isoptericola sediminis]NNU28261.1 NAD-dependent succinate-semialdehyde dehydrogenase [Isoptericola sediminis]
MSTSSTPSTRDLVPEALDAVPTGLLIGGEWRDASDGGTFAVENPATETELVRVASATADDARAAMDAAAAAQDSWGATSARERAEILRRGFDLVQEHAETLATVMTLEMGKPLAESRGEVTYGGEFVRWFAEQATQDVGRYTHTPEGSLRMFVQRRPVGPSFLITPWNFPLAMATRKVAPALAAGCTTILKPARLTPLTSMLFARLMVEAGVPDGVLNVVPSRSASTVSEPILADPRLRKLSFTGSTAVGQSLLRDAATNVLRTSMELGGNAPLVVFEDADLDAAVDGALAAKLRNGGEACTAANRMYVHEDVADAFVDRLAQKLRDVVVGNGLDDGVTLGPLIEPSAVDSVQAFVDDAVERGATLVVGGDRPDGTGHFFSPTLLRDVPPDARCMREEIFGPVAPVATFSSEDEAVALANSTEYGLASYVFTRDVPRGLRFAERLEFGLLGLNAGVISNAAAPFGGMKQSGIGREGGFEGIAEYQETQYVGMPLT